MGNDTQSTADDFKSQVQQLLFNNSTASGDCRERLAQKISDLRDKMDAEATQ